MIISMSMIPKIPKIPGELSRQLSDRHFGAGSDGMIWILPSNVADFKMRIFNADGSEAMMCGNGIRCVGKYVYDKGYTRKTTLTIETLSGIKTLDLKVVNGKVSTVSVDMGKAKVSPSAMLHLEQTEITYQPVSMGNPHAVIFVEDASLAPLTTLGPRIEHHPPLSGWCQCRICSGHQRAHPENAGLGKRQRCNAGLRYWCPVPAQPQPSRQAIVPLTSPLRSNWMADPFSLRSMIIGMSTCKGPATTIYEGEVNEDA